jgi:predicted DNA-binding transcriptional regulator AlpA
VSTRREADLGIILPSQLCRQLGISPITLRAWVRGGKFPKPITFSYRVKAWRIEVVQQWLLDKEDKIDE